MLELAAAVRVGDPALFVRRVEWLRRAAQARTGDDSGVEPPLRSLDAALREEAPAAPARQHRRRARRGARKPAARRSSPSRARLGADDPFGRLALEYITTCLEGDTAAPRRPRCSPQTDGGVTPQDLYCRVLMPAQKEVGRLWHRGDLNVAEERLVSETTRRVMAQLAARYRPAHATGPKVLAAAVAGNAHDLGLRAAADLLALAGWRCLYLGANVPTADIAAMAEAHGVELVLLAATLETQLGATADVDRRNQAQGAVVQNACSAVSTLDARHGRAPRDRRRRVLPALGRRRRDSAPSCCVAATR